MFSFFLSKFYLYARAKIIPRLAREIHVHTMAAYMGNELCVQKKPLPQEYGKKWHIAPLKEDFYH